MRGGYMVTRSPGAVMPRYEYKLVPAPERAVRHKGLKGAASFAATLEEILNELGRDGWHYLRADTLPQDERSGLTSRTTTYRNLLVFQRELPEAATQRTPPPVALVPPDPAPRADSAEQSPPQDLNHEGDAPAQPRSERSAPRFARRPLIADRNSESGGT
jgi:hypothetical protein